jgi:hypothetical protein
MRAADSPPTASSASAGRPKNLSGASCPCGSARQGRGSARGQPASESTLVPPALPAPRAHLNGPLVPQHVRRAQAEQPRRARVEPRRRAAALAVSAAGRPRRRGAQQREHAKLEQPRELHHGAADSRVWRVEHDAVARLGGVVGWRLGWGGGG